MGFVPISGKLHPPDLWIQKWWHLIKSLFGKKMNKDSTDNQLSATVDRILKTFENGQELRDAFLKSLARGLAFQTEAKQWNSLMVLH